MTMIQEYMVITFGKGVLNES